MNPTQYMPQQQYGPPQPGIPPYSKSPGLVEGYPPQNFPPMQRQALPPGPQRTSPNFLSEGANLPPSGQPGNLMQMPPGAPPFEGNVSQMGGNMPQMRPMPTQGLRQGPLQPSGPGNMHPTGPGGMPPMPPSGAGGMPPMPSSGPAGMPPTNSANMAPMPPSGPVGMPPSSRPGMPPMPGSNIPPNMPGGYPPGFLKPGYPKPGGPQMPPGSFDQPGPNQLTQQMSNLNVNNMPPGPPQPPNIQNGNTRPMGMPPMMNPNNPPMGPPHMPPQGMPMSQPPLPGQYVNGVQPPRQGMPPPQPGYNQQYPPAGYPPQYDYPQQQQARKLDPDQMPSPIAVMMDDQNARSGVFATNQKGLSPPLVTTNFITQDQGNASPRYIRSTMYNIPVTVDMMKQANIPFGLLISPFARTVEQEYPPPIVDFGELGPVRCIRCKAYMSPYMQFIDSGRRFQCLFCKATTEVPAEYFQHLDHNGQRVDKYERPELVLGAYEFVATKDYCRNSTFPKPPAMIFVIDVSYNNVKSGLVHLLCAEMKNIIKNLPVDQGETKSKMKVGFITYNKTVHFYNIKGTLAQPQMLVVGDIQDMFMPLLDGFLCDVDESEAVINALTEQIPTIFQETRETETVLLPAIQAGLEALKASECPGKLLVFHSSLPIAEAPGKLKNRDDRKLLGTDKERTVLTPQSNVYNNLGQECVQAGCSVDLYVCNNSYIDLATIGQVARLTGGEIYKYTYFQADVDGPRLINDVIGNISKPIGFDAIMRIRTSTGVRPTDFYGHFFMSNTTDIELASIDCNKGMAIEIKHDDKLTEEDGVYIQAALLYTSCSGQRRLRVLNLALQTCSQYTELYRSCDLDTIMNFYGKQSVHRLLENSPKAVKDSLVQRCAQTLACYRKQCAGPSTAGQLILPECMKLMPLYLSCLLRSDAISGGADMTIDDRTYVMQCLMIMDVPTSVTFLYPKLIPVHDVDPDDVEVPMPIRCSADRMVDNGAYILENGIHMFFWVGLSVNAEYVQSLFGVPSVAQANFEMVELPILDNPLSKRMRSLIEKIRSQRPHCMRLTLVRQNDKLESIFRHFLAEDRGADGSPCYVDFLCHLHKEIRVILS